MSCFRFCIQFQFALKAILWIISLPNTSLHGVACSVVVEMLSIFRTDPYVYDDKQQKHFKRFYSKVVTKIELN
jgi:type IV secretory pathway component VirB8